MPKWAPGTSGNPHGRPRKGHTLTDLIEASLDRDAFVNELIGLAMAKKGDPAIKLGAIKLILGYVDGLPITRGEV